MYSSCNQEKFKALTSIFAQTNAAKCRCYIFFKNYKSIFLTATYFFIKRNIQKISFIFFIQKSHYREYIKLSNAKF